MVNDRIKALWILCVVIPVIGWATPFQVDDPADLREDARATWSDWSTVSGTPVPNNQTFATSDGGPALAVWTEDSGSLTLMDTAGGYFLNGIVLANNGDLRTIIDFSRGVQGFGLTIEHQLAVATTYTVDCFDSDGQFLFTIERDSPGSQGNPAFLSAVDPQARIHFIAIRAGLGGNAVLITDPILQLPYVAATDLDQLPVEGTATVTVDPVDTYLHRGFNGGNRDDPGTDRAAEERPNAHSLLEWFADLHPGDLLRIERFGTVFDGAGTNHVCGLLSRSDELLRGSKIARVPAAISTGNSVFTPSIAGVSGIQSPTNIAADFLVTSDTLVVVPAGARYLFFSRAQPDPAARPLRVRVSHIRRNVFKEWVMQLGLHGSFADPMADFDGDGLSLLEEFFFFKNPFVADASAVDAFSFVPRLVSDDGRLSARLGARSGVPVSFVAEFSSDLVHWEPVPQEAIQPILRDLSGDYGRAIFNIIDPDPGPQRFFRSRTEWLGTDPVLP